MAFRALPTSSSRVRRALLTPTIAVHKHGQTVLNIPRLILRDAGLSDIPNSRVDVLIGTGADEGKIALIEGPRFTLSVGGTSKAPKTLLVRPALGASQFKTQPCHFEVGRRQVIITLPEGFPLRAEAQAAALAVNTRTNSAVQEPACAAE